MSSTRRSMFWELLEDCNKLATDPNHRTPAHLTVGGSTGLSRARQSQPAFVVPPYPALHPVQSLDEAAEFELSQIDRLEDEWS